MGGSCAIHLSTCRILLARGRRVIPRVVDRRPAALAPQLVHEGGAVDVGRHQRRLHDVRRARAGPVVHPGADLLGEQVVGHVERRPALAGRRVLDHHVEHRAGRVALGQRAHGLGLVAAAGAVLRAVGEAPALVLQRVHQLVGEGGAGLLVAQIVGHVHRAVGGLVVAGELVLQQLVLGPLVVELGGDEAEQGELEALVADRLGRQLARDVVLHARDELRAVEQHARHGLGRLQAARGLDPSQRPRDEARLPVVSCIGGSGRGARRGRRRDGGRGGRRHRSHRRGSGDGRGAARRGGHEQADEGGPHVCARPRSASCRMSAMAFW